jgi:S1-C subfamily serine protease
MKSKALLFLIALVIVGIVLAGIGAGAVTVLALRAGGPQALVSQVVGNVTGNNASANTAQRVGLTQQDATPTATPAPAASAQAPVTINVQPGVDAESQILEAVYQKVNPSVVTVYNLAAQTSRFGGSSGTDVPQGEGSGFVWDTQGRIVTNDHVVRGADKLQVTFADGTQVDATLVGTDPNGDIAVIQVDPKATNLVPVSQGDSDALKVGQTAIAIGNPFGLNGTMTRGIVSALGRTIPSQTAFSIPEAIQTDAAINPGNSGGPLLDNQGNVIGVNDQIQSSSGSNSGVGFAIPMSIVKRIVPSIIKTGHYQHAYLGIEGSTYTRAWSQPLGFPADAKGAYVMNVTAGGPAANAGIRSGSQNTSLVLGQGQTGTVYLQSGGDLITAVDGHKITNMDDLLIYLEENTSSGQIVKFSVLRSGGQQSTLSVTLGVRPEQTQQNVGG